MYRDGSEGVWYSVHLIPILMQVSKPVDTQVMTGEVSLYDAPFS